MKIMAKVAIASVVAVVLLTTSVAYAGQLADDTNFKAAVGAQELMSDKGVQENLKREWADHFDTLNATEQRDAYTEAMLQGKISITDIVAYDARNRYIEHYIESLLELEHGSHTSFADVSYLEKLAALGNTTELEKDNAKLEKENKKLNKIIDNKNEKIQELKDARLDKNAEIKKLNKIIDKLQNQRENKREKVADLKGNVTDMKAQMAEMESRPTDLGALLKEYEKNIVPMPAPETDYIAIYGEEYFDCTEAHQPCLDGPRTNATIVEYGNVIFRSYGTLYSPVKTLAITDSNGTQIDHKIYGSTGIVFDEQGVYAWQVKEYPHLAGYVTVVPKRAVEPMVIDTSNMKLLEDKLVPWPARNNDDIFIYSEEYSYCMGTHQPCLQSGHNHVEIREGGWVEFMIHGDFADLVGTYTIKDSNGTEIDHKASGWNPMIRFDDPGVYTWQLSGYHAERQRLNEGVDEPGVYTWNIGSKEFQNLAGYITVVPRPTD